MLELLKEFQKALSIWQELADASPADTAFHCNLAWTHINMGGALSRTGRLAEGQKEIEKARAIMQKLADASPAVTAFQSFLASSHDRIGRLHAREKRFAEAFAALDQALAIRQKLADAHDTDTDDINDHASSHAYRGWAHVRAGHAAEAAADLRRALALWEKAKASDVEDQFERGRALALLVGVAKDGKSGVTAAEAAAFAGQAVAALRDAFKAGWGQYDELKEPDFDPLRKRHDFQKLQKEVETKSANRASPDKQPQQDKK